MKLYRYSPITSEDKLYQAIEYIHRQSHMLCKEGFGSMLQNSGNISIFCHYPDEYQYLDALRQEMTNDIDNINQKYYRLKKPFTFPGEKFGAESVTYTHMYIREPDPYRSQVGNIDFYLPDSEYQILKRSLLIGKNGSLMMREFGRSDLDMIELYGPDYDVLVYITTVLMKKEIK